MGKNLCPTGRRAKIEAELRRELGPSFELDNEHNDGRVLASWDYVPEAREEEDRVFGGDPLRRFVPSEEFPAVETEEPTGSRLCGDLLDVFSVMGKTWARQSIKSALVEHPELLGVAFWAAAEQNLIGVLTDIEEVAMQNIARLGNERVVDLLLGQGVNIGRGYSRNSIQALQQLSRGEFGYIADPAKQILSALGFTEADINKGRLRPAKA